MTLSQEQLAEKLKGRPLRYFDVVDSTNDLALDWLREGAASGSVIVADEQRKGRGRLGRTWHTPPGVALAVSVILRPPAESLHQVTMLGALAVAEMGDELGLQNVGIKWPNDVQINGLKVAGVLPEASWQGDQLEGAVLGIGVNVRVDFSGTDLAQTATSIEPQLGQPLDRVELLVSLLARMDIWAEKIGTVDLFAAWQRRLNMIGEAVNVLLHDGELMMGVAESVDQQGALHLRRIDGTLTRIFVGDVTG